MPASNDRRPPDSPSGRGSDSAKTSRRSRLLRREMRRRLRGRPSRSPTLLSVPKLARRSVWRVLKVVLMVLVIVGMLGGGVLGGMVLGYVSTAEELTVAELKIKTETSYIYDVDGNVMAKLTGTQNVDRQVVSWDQVKDTWLPDAFKAIEDERFDTHIGIDPRRIGSAVLSFFTNAGTATHGGSTITQQTVKMISGKDQVSAQRKIQEWYNAIRLEKKLTKWEILELYMNLVPMANNYVGVQSAAKAYFGKDAKDLDLAECAVLAGIPNLPSYYNPFTESGRRNVLRRQRIVLGKMLELKMISQAQYDDALNTEVVFLNPAVTTTTLSTQSYFTDYVIDQVKKDLVDRKGMSADLALTAIYNYGYRIQTTMDPAVQSQVDAAFNTRTNFVSNENDVKDFPEQPQAGMVVLDNENGQIRAMYGGYGAKTGNFVLNRATDIHRQPGSSIKPLDVYGPGIDLGRITASTTMEDKEVFLDNQNPNTPYPKNSYKGFFGVMTVRNALKVSSNTFAAQIWLTFIGGNDSVAYLKSVGIDRVSERYVSIALGGFNKGMCPLDMAGGYLTFASGGLYMKPVAYTTVTDIDGTVILENKPAYQQVYRPESAFIMTKLLEEPLLGADSAFGHSGTAAAYGPVKNAKGQTISTAGKTGTTDNNRDKWFVGFTPYYTAAVWYGYDNRLKTIEIPPKDQGNAIKIWSDVMKRIHADKTPTDWYRPSSIKTARICIASGQLATPNCEAAGHYVISEFFISGTVPTTYCEFHNPIATPTPEISPDVTPDVTPGDTPTVVPDTPTPTP